MASFFNLTLDTLAPEGLAVSLNDNALYTTNPVVTLKITLTDADTSGYQMKIWGTETAASEGAATWETYAATKSITLPSDTDGLKTVYVKIRDDVGNETAAASDDITLDTAVPVVSITGPDKAKVSKVAGFDISIINFTVDVEFAEFKVCVVPETASTQDAGVTIGTAGGSVNVSGDGGNYPAATNIEVKISGTDLETASGGDGVKVIKVFVKTAAGTWSVA